MFKLHSFQEQALSALKKPNHVLCVAPTGSGKSLIYERYAASSAKKTLLVTPLLALARQQRENLLRVGVHVSMGAGTPSAGPPSSESGVWIVSPETLLNPTRQNVLNHWRPEFLVIDECHCLWEWGDHFRPAFSHLPQLIRSYPIKRSLWLTATLPYEARKQLRAELPANLVEIGAFSLPPQIHLTIAQVPWASRTDALTYWVGLQKGAGVVFTSTRDSTLRLARLLQASGKSAVAYHAGLSNEERHSIEAAVASREVDVVIATSAYGMGMDHGHLRWVVLWQAPPSLLSLAQSIGRVGRGRIENQGRALVLWDYDDFRLLEWSVQGLPRRKKDLLETFEYLRSKKCRKSGLLQFFERDHEIESPEIRCNACDICDLSITSCSTF